MRSKKPVQGLVRKRLDRVAKVETLKVRERERHCRKTATLAEQLAAARRIHAAAQRDLAVARITGQQVDEAAKHKNKMADLDNRQRDIWK